MVSNDFSHFLGFASPTYEALMVCPHCICVWEWADPKKETWRQTDQFLRCFTSMRKIFDSHLLNIKMPLWAKQFLLEVIKGDKLRTGFVWIEVAPSHTWFIFCQVNCVKAVLFFSGECVSSVIVFWDVEYFSVFQSKGGPVFYSDAWNKLSGGGVDHCSCRLKGKYSLFIQNKM